MSTSIAVHLAPPEEKLENVDDTNRYSLKEQSKYFAAFLEAIDITQNVTFVTHSWGASLAAHWASWISGTCKL